jgi:predicted MFS family arabinose efflux permease
MRQVLRLPVYRRLLAAFVFNELAWSVGTIALSVVVYRRTGSAIGSTGFFLCSQVFPALVSPSIVARLDQRAPNRVLPLLYALEALLFGVLAWETSRFSLVPVLVLTLADGVVAITARVLASAARVEILKPVDLLHEGNALSNGLFSICFMLGPLLGGAVVVAGGTVAALLINCGFFAVMALLLATGSLPGVGPDLGPLAGRLRAALAHARADRPLLALFLLQAVGFVFFTISIPVEVVFAQHTLHAGPGGYGVLLSSWGAGAVLGSLVYARWRRGSDRVLVGASSAALGVGFTLMSVAPTLLIAAIGAAVGGAGNVVVAAATRTAVQARTPTRWIALMMSLNESITQLAPGLGIVLGGVITALASTRAAFGVAAAGSILFAAAALAVMRPSRMTPAPGEPEPATGSASTNGAAGAPSASHESLV